MIKQVVNKVIKQGVKQEKGEKSSWERNGNKQRISKSMMMLKFLCTGRAKKSVGKEQDMQPVLRLQIFWMYCDSVLPDRSQQIHQRNRICSPDTKQSRHGI